MSSHKTKENAWDTEKFLGNFFTRGRLCEFRMLLEASGSLVFGPAVLKFLDRSVVEADILDIGHALICHGIWAFLPQGRLYSSECCPSVAWVALFPFLCGQPSGEPFLDGDIAKAEESQQSAVYMFA